MMQPIAQYAFSSCDLYRSFASLSEVSYAGPLLSSRPELLNCDSTLGLSVDRDLLPTQNLTKRPHSMGKSTLPVFLESQLTLAALQEHVQERNTTTGWTFATWFTPTNVGGGGAGLQPIFTVGNLVPPIFEVDNYDASSLSGCFGYDFQLTMLKEDIYVSYTDGPTSSPTCRFIRTIDLNAFGPTHVAVTFQTNEIKVYVNGETKITSLSRHFDTMLQHWDLRGSNLQLFGARSSDRYFFGSIHQLDIYDQGLNSSDVSTLYQNGIHSIKAAEIKVDAVVEHVVLRQNTSEGTTLQLGSHNTSSSVLNLEIEFVSLPEHGILTVNSAPVNQTSRLILPTGTSRVSVEYTLNSSVYFNVPAKDAYDVSTFGPESFTFRIVALDFKTREIAASPVATQMINVIHVNNVGVLVAPIEVVRDVLDPQFAIVTNVAYTDALDKNVDRVRVDLVVSHGELSLLPTYRSRADFDSCRHREGSWVCVGDGINDAQMTFLAIPYDIQFILRSLTYRTNNPKVTDEILIRISDGSGGMCLNQAEHTQYKDLNGELVTSFRDDCFQSQAVVRVPSYAVVDPVVDPTAKSPSSRTSGGLFGFSFLHAADIIFWSLVAMIVGCCALGCRRLAQCCSRGRSVDVDDKEATIKSVGRVQVNNSVV